MTAPHSIQKLCVLSLFLFIVTAPTSTLAQGTIFPPAGTRVDYPTGLVPVRAAFDNITNSVWVTNAGSNTVSKIDIYAGTRVDYPTGLGPGGVVFDTSTNSVWVTNFSANTVSKMDIHTGARVDYPASFGPDTIAFDNITGSVWVTNFYSHTVSKIDIHTGSRIEYPISSYPSEIAFDNVTNSVWVTSLYSNTVSKIDIHTGTSIDYPIGIGPHGIAFDNVTNSVWVTNSGSNTVSKIDIHTGTRIDYPTGFSPFEIAFDNITNSVWVVHYYSHTVSKIDIHTGTGTDYPTDLIAYGIAFDNVTNSIWVTNSSSNTVSKIAIGTPISYVPVLSVLRQFKSDGITPIPEGGVTTESSPDNPANATVVFKATLASLTNNTVKLQVEIKEYGQGFDGTTGIVESGFVPSGNVAAVTRYGLVNGHYHWRARAVDSQNTPSAWQEFGTPGNVDFVVNLTLSAKAAELAKGLINYPYLLGGKGWDYNQHLFVTANTVKTGYNFWNRTINQGKGGVDFGIGVDCSGLVMWTYDRSFDPLKSRFHNFVKAESADEQYNHNTATTTESQLQPGDVMFFDWNSDGFIDHVAMYVGDSGGYDVVSAVDRITGIVGKSKDSYKQISGFKGFERVIPALPPAVLITAHSPVDLVVTDPDGFTITPTTVASSSEEYLREIPGVLYYSEMEQGTDGNPIDQVYSYTAKTGDYTIRVLPASNATSTSTYTLDFSAGNQSITLAQDTPVSQIPSQGYGVTTSATGTLSTFIPVAIDIKPGSYPNSINLGSNGVVPVAILGSATLDVRQIDPTTIKLANASVKLKGNSQPMVSYSDVNGDGFTDITVNVTTEAVQLTVNDVKANLQGQLMNGVRIKGSDSVRIVP